MKEKGYSSYSGNAMHPAAIVSIGGMDARVVMDTLQLYIN
jgi:hypothetical protein